MVAIVLAGMTVYHILYDQTEKVKGVMTTQGLLPTNLQEQLSRSVSRDYTRQLADDRMGEYRRSQDAMVQQSS
jgi:hypothetical protein